MDHADDHGPVHPGRILLERVMQPLGISRNQLARDIDVPVGRISDITNGKRGITADTAMRLGRYFGVPAQLWLRLQAEHDLHIVRTTTWNRIEPRVRVLEAAKAPPAVASPPMSLQTELVPADLGAADTPPLPPDAAPVEFLELTEPADSLEAVDPIGIPPLPSTASS